MFNSQTRNDLQPHASHASGRSLSPLQTFAPASGFNGPAQVLSAMHGFLPPLLVGLPLQLLLQLRGRGCRKQRKTACFQRPTVCRRGSAGCLPEHAAAARNHQQGNLCC